MMCAPRRVFSPSWWSFLGALLLAGLVVAPPDSAANADDPVFSGPQPGEKLTSFKLMGVYDEAAGKEFDPIADADGDTTMMVFVHKLTRPGLGLARGLTRYAETLEEPDCFSVIAWLADDKADAEEFLNRARKSLNVNVPIGISVDGGEGPGAYGLNRNVELTILLAKDNKVFANYALVQPSMSDGVKIAGQLAKFLGKPAPTADELQKIAYPGRNMQMRRRQPPTARGGDARGGTPRTPPTEAEKTETKPADE